MPEKSYKQLGRDVDEILESLAKGEMRGLAGKVIALCAVVKHLLEKLEKESAS